MTNQKAFESLLALLAVQCMAGLKEKAPDIWAGLDENGKSAVAFAVAWGYAEGLSREAYLQALLGTARRAQG